MYYDRYDAGEQLAEALHKYKDRKNTVIMALPRGGVVPGYVIAQKLHLPLEVIMVKKIGHPDNLEFAIGAVTLKSRMINDNAGVSTDYIERATAKIRELLQERYTMYHGDKPAVELKGKNVIVVDDGVATGNTLMAALQLIAAEEPSQIIVAVPVGPTATITKLHDYADKVVCLETYDEFYAIGLYYKNFDQVTDDEVTELLEKAGHVGVP